MSDDNQEESSLLENLQSTQISPLTKKILKTARSQKKSKKSFSWAEGPHNPTKGEAALWLAVITQAMMDALSNAKNAEAAYYKHEAISWLTGNSKNFIDVCQMAGMDPAYIRKKAKKCLASPTQWRAAPGKGKRYQERRAYRLKVRKLAVELPEQVPEILDSGKIIQGPWR